jgi:hypothetical protein
MSQPAIDPLNQFFASRSLDHLTGDFLIQVNFGATFSPTAQQQLTIIRKFFTGKKYVDGVTYLVSNRTHRCRFMAFLRDTKVTGV